MADTSDRTGKASPFGSARQSEQSSGRERLVGLTEVCIDFPVTLTKDRLSLIRREDIEREVSDHLHEEVSRTRWRTSAPHLEGHWPFSVELSSSYGYL